MRTSPSLARGSVHALGLALALSLASLPAPTRAQSGGAAIEEGQALRSQLIYGSQLMTPAERDAYRKAWEAAPPQDKDRVERQHRDRMRLRARLQGVTLSEPDGVITGNTGWKLPR